MFFVYHNLHGWYSLGSLNFCFFVSGFFCSFLTSVSYSLPIVLMVAWVVFIAAFVKKLVYEKDLRLHEVCQESLLIMNKIYCMMITVIFIMSIQNQKAWPIPHELKKENILWIIKAADMAIFCFKKLYRSHFISASKTQNINSEWNLSTIYNPKSNFCSRNS